MTLADLAPLAIAIPLAGGAVLLGAGRWLRRGWIDALSLVAAVAALAACLALAAGSRSAPIVAWMGHWLPRDGIAVGISLYVDPLGGAVAALACVLMAGALLFSSRYFEEAHARFHACMLLFLAAMVGFALTLDLFNLFVWFELMSVTAFALTGYEQEEPAAVQGGINFAITNSVGAFASLIGLSMIYGRTGALNLAQIGAALGGGHVDALVTAGLFLVCSGLLIKAAIVPFHFWLADAHAVAPSPACVLFSGIMVELGLYGVARIFWVAYAGVLGAHASAFEIVLVGAGVVTVVFASIACVFQSHLKRLLAFSTIAHAGIMLIGIGLRDPGALAGTLLYIGGHGLTKGALFLCAGILIHRFDSIHERRLHGRARALRGTFLVYALGCASLADAYPFGTAAGRELLDGALTGRAHVLVYVITFGTILTAGAALRAGLRIFLGWGHPPARDEQHTDVGQPETRGGHDRIPAVLFVPAAAFVVLAAALGLAGRAGSAELVAAAVRFASPMTYAHAVLGVPAAPPAAVAAPAAGPWAGLASVVGAIAVAGVALWLGPPLRRRAEPVARALRALHDGDAGKYVTWMFAGLAVMGAAFVGLATAG